MLGAVYFVVFPLLFLAQCVFGISWVATKTTTYVFAFSLFLSGFLMIRG